MFVLAIFYLKSIYRPEFNKGGIGIGTLATIGHCKSATDLDGPRPTVVGSNHKKMISFFSIFSG
jgi:hypothetical protein